MKIVVSVDQTLIKNITYSQLRNYSFSYSENTWTLFRKHLFFQLYGQIHLKHLFKK